MNECKDLYANKNHWLAFFDIDEFIILTGNTIRSKLNDKFNKNINNENNIPQLPLLLQDYENFNGLFINTQTISNYPHIKKPTSDYLVTESYNYIVSESTTSQNHAKLFLNTKNAPIESCNFSMKDRGFYHNCLYSKHETQNFVVDENLIPINDPWYIQPSTTNYIYINHYSHKSIEECISKIKRGYTWYAGRFVEDWNDWAPNFKMKTSLEICKMIVELTLKSKIDNINPDLLHQLKNNVF